MIFKKCFRCKGQKHILSNKQFKKLRDEYTNSRGQVNWKSLRDNIENSEALCRLCHGKGELIYPQVGD